MNSYIKSADAAQTVIVHGPLLYFALEAATEREACTRTYMTSAFPTYAGAPNSYWVFASDKLRSGVSSVTIDGDTLTVAHGNSASPLYWSVESDKLSAVRYGSVGSAMFSGATANGITGFGELRVDSGMTANQFLDLMIKEEAVKAGPASGKLEEWLRERMQGLRAYTQYATKTLISQVPLVKVGEKWHLGQPGATTKVLIPDDILLVSSAAGAEVDFADVGQIVVGWLDAFDNRLSNSQVDTVIPPEMTSASDAALAGLFNSRLNAASGTYNREPNMFTTSGNSLPLWYALAATAARKDDSIDNFVRRAGYRSLRAMFANCVPDPQFVGVRT